MDIHTVDPETPWEDIAGAHMKDMDAQVAYGVDYKKYWFNRERGKLFCLVDAPSEHAAHCVHQEAHGLVAEKLIEVDPELLDSFLGGTGVNDAGAALAPGATSPTDRDTGVRAVMFTDIVDSTQTTSEFGDDAAMAVVRLHDMIVRASLAAFRGCEIKHTGDGIMAAFLSAASAVRCGCHIMTSVEASQRMNGPRLSLRIGISAGEPVEENNDLFGSTVQLASRLCGSAEPGGILVSNVVSDLCAGKGLTFADTGPRELKGFSAPVHTHAVKIDC